MTDKTSSARSRRHRRRRTDRRHRRDATGAARRGLPGARPLARGVPTATCRAPGRRNLPSSSPVSASPTSSRQFRGPRSGLRLLDNRFQVLAEFNRDPSRSPNGFPQANMFDQPELEALLRAHLKRYPDARLRGDAEVTEVTECGETVRVTFTDRSDGHVHQVDADYLLGCDGANSMVRAHIGSAMRDLNFEQRWLVVDVASNADLHQWDGVHQVCDPVRAGTYMRIGPARYRWEFQLLAGETADDFRTLTALRPLIAPWTADVANSELTLLRVSEYTFRAQIADRWRRGNIFILGDAAHLTPPFTGQGMGAGVRDAANLAWKIAGVHNGTLAADVLDSYEQERKPHTRHMIRLALGVGRAMTGGGRVGNVARRVVLPRLRLVPGLRDKVVDSTTPALHCFCAGVQIPPTAPARRHAVPESAAARRSTARRRGRHRFRLDHHQSPRWRRRNIAAAARSRRAGCPTWQRTRDVAAPGARHGRDRAPRPDSHRAPDATSLRYARGQPPSCRSSEGFTQTHDGRATITGIRTECRTALLTEPSSMPVKPPRP